MFKKIIFAGVGLTMLATPLVTSGLTCPSLTHDLQLHSTDATTGGEVSQLQTFLNQYYAGNPPTGLWSLPINGFFGPITLSWVVKFQGNNGLPPTGFVGPLTRAAIASACNGSVAPPANPP